MLHNFNWLNRGEAFPPASEIERLCTYRDNRALFNGEDIAVLRSYRTRLQAIANRFSILDGGVPDTYSQDLNYWQLTTLKTGDLVCGEPPTVNSSKEKAKDILKLIQQETVTGEKILTLVYDLSRFGDGIMRVKVNEKGKGAIVIIAPDQWFPIVNSEDYSEVFCHALAWKECLNPRAPKGQKQYVLSVQKHYRGSYIKERYALSSITSETLESPNGNPCDISRYNIGAMIEAPVTVETGLDDFAIVPAHNVTTSDSPYGIADYDRITTIIAELEVRYALASLILDKHSAPLMCGPDTAAAQNQAGEWVVNLGGYIPVRAGEQPPAYLTWDGALTANTIMIDKLEKHLHSLSELGAVIDDDSFGASQGYEALETRLTNAKTKARRLSSKLTDPIKKVLALVSQIGYDRIESEDISVFWNDGLPQNEYRETEIAERKVRIGYDRKSVLVEHFGKTDEEAEIMAERAAEERSQMFPAGFGGET